MIWRPKDRTLRAVSAMRTGGRKRCQERPSAPSSYTLFLVRSRLFQASILTWSLYSELNAGQTPLRYLRLRLLHFPKGEACVDIVACYRTDRPRTSASFCRIARSLPRFPHFRTANYCCTQMRWGTCNVALSEYLILSGIKVIKYV